MDDQVMRGAACGGVAGGCGQVLDLGEATKAVNHSSHLLSLLHRLRRNDSLADVVLLVKPSGNEGEAHRFPCHRVILSLWSEVFRNMFECSSSGVVEAGRVQEVTLAGDDPQAVETMLDYCYTGQLTLGKHNIMAVMALADKYTITSVVKSCGKFLSQHITVDNVVSILESSQQHSAAEPESKCKALLKDRFHLVCKDESFLRMDWKNVEWLLGCDGLVCESELSVFESAMAWVSFEPGQRLERLPAALQLVRFSRFNAADLGAIDRHPVASQAGELYLRLLLDAYKAASAPQCSIRTSLNRNYFNFWISGVVHDLPVPVIEAQGWVEAYRRPYSHPTSEEEIRAAAEGYGSMLVGAKACGSGCLELCAAGEVARVLKPTHSRYDFHEENGAHWYCWEGKAFGFSKGKQVDLFWADVCQFQGDDRLSWVLDGRGGWRVGKTFLYDSSEAIHNWEKVIYVKDATVSTPRASSVGSLQPSP
mmetsp:Transcript_13723/g.38838  ORF Transcript_13723/g.38838 Transcript_13723/m.38838 type:complete len:479 (+) Transcript_13723:113-1549(+)